MTADLHPQPVAIPCDLEQELAATQLLLAASYRFSDTTTTEQAADVLADVACRLTGASGAHVYVPEEVGATVMTNANVARTSIGRGVLRLDLDVEAPDVRACLEQRRGFFVADGAADGQLRRPLRARFGMESLLFLPLSDVGVLVLWWTTRLAEPPVYEGDLTTFAEHAGQVLRRRIDSAVLRGQTLCDPLTGLANRRALLSALQSLPARGCLALIDLDHFKAVNDRFGHRRGDLALQGFATALRAVCPSDGCAARYGGEEFALVLPSGTEAQARHLLSLAADKWAEDLTFSVGLAVHRHGASGEETMEAADRALYVAKRTGRDRIVVDPDVAWNSAASAVQRPRVERRSGRRSGPLDLAVLDGALAAGLVEAAYQPVMSTVTGRVTSVEALARLRHPDTGKLLQPRQFLPLAERTGRVARVDWLVAEQAIAQCAAWRRAEPYQALTVAVNVSVAHLDDPRLADRLIDACARSALPPQALIVEVTETMNSERGRGHGAAVQALTDAGVNVTLDDFGTGFAAMSYLLRFPVSGLKIDQSFTVALGEERGIRVVAAVLEVGVALGLHVVAEGVETEEQLEQLTSLGCAFAQGYLLGRPVPAPELPALVAAVERRRGR